MDRVVRRVGREQVDAEQHTVRVLQDQPPAPRAAGGRAPRSAPRCPRGSSGTSSSIRPTHARSSAIAADVRADERRGRMRGDDRLERVDQPLEPREPWIGERPIGMREQLLEPFVARVDRLEERHRIRDVDHDRQPRARRRRPTRRRAVRRRGAASSPRSSRSPRPRSFQTLMPRAPASADAAELRARAGPASRAPATPCQSRWQNVANRPGCARSYRSRFASSSSPHRPSRFTIASTLHDVHVGEQRTDVARRPSAVGRQPAAEVVVRVDHREPRARHEVSRQPDGRARPVLAQRKVAQRRVERRGLQTGRSHGVTRW